MAFFPLAHVRFERASRLHPAGTGKAILLRRRTEARRDARRTPRTGAWSRGHDFTSRPEVGLSGPIYLTFAASVRYERTSGQKPMEEKRKHPRTEINEPAYVSSGGSVMSCVVRNISLEGAAIDVENPAFVPQRFRLVMANDSSVHECQIAWIQKNRIGVIFAEMS
jgi:hypothetical protein